MRLLRFLKEWTLAVSIALGALCYLVFLWVPALDEAGDAIGPVIDFILPLSVFGTLFVTFCKVDFKEMRPHRWHIAILGAQLVLVALNVCVIFWFGGLEGGLQIPLNGGNCPSPLSVLVGEAVLTCVIAPSATAAPVVTGKLGGNISTMSAFTVISAFAGSLMIPFVFPLLEVPEGVVLGFWGAFLIILKKVATVLVLPLLLGWLVQRKMRCLRERIVGIRDLSFYCWAFSLCITSGITVKNIVHSGIGGLVLLLIGVLTLLVCFVQFWLGRFVGRHVGESINCGQALFQKNTALAIWAAYMYLNPVASVGAGCYVLWQNMINSVEIWRAEKRGAPQAPEGDVFGSEK